ncbi:MAG TPA: hypothetical protein VFK70_05005 [Vicinamibacteria bacterium]|nr:hypothetical protein [Vicinamibacteria bacterium]
MEPTPPAIGSQTRAIPVAPSLLGILGAVLFVRYVAEHWELLVAPTPDAWVWPKLEATAPQGGAAAWVVLAAALVGGWGLARRWPRRPGLLTWGVGTLLTLLIPAHVLGAAGLLSGRALFTPWAWAAGTCLAAVALAWPRPRAAAPSPRAVDVKVGQRDLLVLWFLPIAVLIAGLQAHAIGRTFRSGPRCWDGEAYHLPVALQWLGVNSLTEVLVRLLRIGPDSIHYYTHPGNGHLLMCLPLLLGWDFLACLVQLPFLPLAAWSCYALARAAGGSPGAAALSALAFLSAPIVVEQASVPLVDLATATLSLAALALLMPVAGDETVSATRVGLAGLCAGLAIGTKTTALAHLGLLAVLVGTSRWAWKRPFRLPLRTLGRLAVLMLVPSAFWYLRSAVLLGNPIYPIGFHLGDHVLLDGATAEDLSGDWEVSWMGVKSRWEWLAVPLRDPVYFSEAGFGALLVAIGGLGLVAGAAALLGGLGDRRLTPMRRLSLVAATGVAIFFLVAARTPRFNLPLFAVLAALGGPAIDALGTGWRRHVVGFLGVVAAAVTLTLAIHQHGWAMAPRWSRRERLEKDLPAVPLAVDGLSPLVLFNDTHDDETSRPSTYWLFGSDHRHTVLEHAGLAADDPATFLRRVRALGANAVFSRTRKDQPLPARYDTPALQPVARWEGGDYRGVIYLIR